MNAKNEAASLPSISQYGALSRHNHIGDSGSIDKTSALAGNFGAKMVRLP